MKKVILLFGAALLTCAFGCSRSETESTTEGINFCSVGSVSASMVTYGDIIGYDSTKYTFRITKKAWKSIDSELLPKNKGLIAGFDVVQDGRMIYTARYIPDVVSCSMDSIITFRLVAPDLVEIGLGYPASYFPFKGIDNRNDSELLAQLKKDNKLIKIEKE